MKSHVLALARDDRPFIAVVAIAILMGHTGFASVLTGPVTNPANGHLYYLLNAASWTQSQRTARSLGGHLVTINDHPENTWVLHSFRDYGGVARDLWIGTFDPDPSDNAHNHLDRRQEFVWASGDPSRYQAWRSSQPDHPPYRTNPPLSAMFYGLMMRDGFWVSYWNDAIREGRPINGVVEVIPNERNVPMQLILTTDGEIRISWPGWASGFAVQQSTSLSSPVWETLSAETQLEGGLYSITFAADPKGGYFRLWKPDPASP